MVASASSPLLGSAPIPRTRLIGRETERETARVLLIDDTVPLLTLTGPGGVGKTRLALAVAADVASRFADGVVWVDLAPLADPALVPQIVAGVLGVTLEPEESATQAVARFLRPRQCLLLIDNCEHVLDETAALVSTLIRSCPALQILATSRAQIRLHDEQVLPIEPLPAPTADTTVEAMHGNAAVRLFVERARAVRPGFHLHGANAGSIVALCRCLDGLPLAIELAAARIRRLSPDALLAHMTERLRLLSDGPRDAPARQRTIAATIAWSYDLLAAAEQALFRRLAVFSGGFTVAAARAIAFDAGTADIDVLLALSDLADQSLIQPMLTATDEPRFRLLETIREFGLKRLAACGEDDDARERHAAFFRGFIADLDLHSAAPADPFWFNRVVPEEDNLRQALERFLARGDRLALSELSSGLTVLWETRSQFGEGRRWLELAIAGDQDLPADLRSRGREAAGLFIGYHGDAAVAAPILEEAVALARECGDPVLLRHALFSLGTVVLMLRDFPRAMAVQEEAERAARAINPDVPNSGLFVGLTLYAQGVVAQRSGDTATALARFAQAEPYLRAPGGNRRLGMMLGERGVIQVCAGNVHEATATLVESVALTWDVRNVAALTRPLRGLAAVAAATAQTAAAAYLLGAAGAIDRSTPHAAVAASRDRDIVAWCLAHLAAAVSATTLDHQQRTGTGLTVEHAVALARQIAMPVLGAARVAEIWQATGAPDPGPAPTTHPTDLHLVSSPATSDAGKLLTLREREVLVLLCRRLTDLEIAADLFISPRTASRHVSNILAKLDAPNRREAAATAARSGLV